MAQTVNRTGEDLGISQHVQARKRAAYANIVHLITLQVERSQVFYSICVRNVYVIPPTPTPRLKFRCHHLVYMLLIVSCEM